MVFSSHLFLFGFLPFVLALYYGVPRPWRNFVLTATSYLFYGWATPYFILLISWSTIVDYVCGNFIFGHWRIGRTTDESATGQRLLGYQRRLFLLISLLSNVGMLAFFKYFTFAENNLNSLLELTGNRGFELLVVTLPVGISFYTFESISYNLDIYYGRAKPAIAWVQELDGPQAPRGFVRRAVRELRALSAFACYITQFPHLVAGPIIRYQDLEKQIHLRSHTLEKFGRGVFFFSLGLAKKVLIANAVGEVADMAFAARALSPLDAWYGLFAYAFQIYFDFSGYSDMAIGLGLMVGFEFAKNFDSPYKSQSITEFWRRWHISLSTWLRDYLYIPLGGNRLGPTRTYVNLIVVMLLGGLWHGASWNFLAWGGVHGVWLSVERLNRKASFYENGPVGLRVAVTFLIVNVAWVFFRAPDLRSSVWYLAGMSGWHTVSSGDLLLRSSLYSPFHVLWFVVATVVAFFCAQSWELSKAIGPGKALYALFLLSWSVMAMSAQAFSPFLYFRF